MKLLYAFPEPLPLPRARGVQVAHAVASLSSAGVAIDFAYVPVAGQSPLAPVGEAAPPGVALLPLSRGWPPPLNRIPPFSRWHSVRFFAGRLTREIRRRRPDVLYVRHLKLAALLLRHESSTPLIYEAHEAFSDTASPRRRADIAALEQAVVRGAAAMVCNSQATARRLTELYGENRHVLVLPNGVARPDVLPAKPWQQARRHVIYAGSFFGWKGVADLVAAAAELDGFRITLIGGEPSQTEQMRAVLPVGGAEIELLPRLPHAAVMNHLTAACIAVLPNRAEPDSAFTSPIKLFEYMAAGCAVVASDLPAIREILAADEAVWFEPGNAGALAAALRRLADDVGNAEAIGEKLRAKSAAYGWAGRAHRLKAFIEGALRSA